MEPICSHQKIEISGATVLESDVNSPFRLFNAAHAITEDCFDPARDFAENGCRKLSSRKADKAALRDTAKCFNGKPCDAFTPPVYHSYFPDPVSFADDLWQQAQTFGDVESRPPEIDNIAASSQFRR
jgi:hypothetical protein